MSKKKNLEDAEVKAEFDKLISRVPGWFKAPEHKSSTILIAFMKLYDESDCRTVSLQKLKECCKEMETFDGNIADLKRISEHGFGKIFDVTGDKITLWTPVELFIVNLWRKYSNK